MTSVQSFSYQTLLFNCFVFVFNRFKDIEVMSFDKSQWLGVGSHREYTEEQLFAVKQIKKCKDYYEILGVTKESTASGIKKQYHWLALQLHPDKNKAPGASEAFIMIGNAFAVLSDAQKKKQYDMYGSEEQQRKRWHQTYENGYNDYYRSFKGFSADQFFNMSFGRGFPSGDVYFPHNPRYEGPAEDEVEQNDNNCADGHIEASIGAEDCLSDGNPSEDSGVSQSNDNTDENPISSDNESQGSQPGLLTKFI